MRATKTKQSQQKATQEREIARSKAKAAKGGLGIKALLDDSFIPFLLGHKPKEREPEAGDEPAPKKAEKKNEPAPEPSAETESVKNAQYDKVEGEAFVKGKGDERDVQADDVKQGSLGDCYLVAAMAAVAHTDPDVIKNMIKDNGDGTYTVTFHLKEGMIGVFSSGSTVSITVTDKFPMRGDKPAFAKTGDGGEKGPELWVMLIEKAWAVHQGSYEQTRGSKVEKNADITSFLTGKKSNTLYCSSTSEPKLLEAMFAGCEGEHPMTAGMPGKKSASEDQHKLAEDKKLYFNHAYTVISVDKSGSKIILRNPWGSHDPKPLKIGEFKKIFKRVRINAA